MFVCVTEGGLEHRAQNGKERMCRIYSASHSRVAPENVGLQKEQTYNTVACHTCNEMRLSQEVLEMASERQYTTEHDVACF
jgi:hypothetical protein